jgi:hypothetical protein
MSLVVKNTIKSVHFSSFQLAACNLAAGGETN